MEGLQLNEIWISYSQFLDEYHYETSYDFIEESDDWIYERATFRSTAN